MVTSSAVVGSSAMTRRGLLENAKRDQHALAHAARQLMRILRQQFARRAAACAAASMASARVAAPAAAAFAEPRQMLVELRADGPAPD